MYCLLKAFIPRKGGRRSRRDRDADDSIRSLIDAQNWPLVKKYFQQLQPKSTCTFNSELEDGTFGSSGTSLTLDKRSPNGVDLQNSLIDNDNNETLLHHTCKNQPPLEIVRLINEKYPDLISVATTKEKHYPVHVACMYGAHPEVISFLVKEYPFGASSKTVNFEGRTALHLICVEYSIHYKVVDMVVSSGDLVAMGKLGDEHRQAQMRNRSSTDIVQAKTPLISSGKPLSTREAMLKSVRILTKNFPDIVVVNDDDDMIALEYAICGNLPIDIVKSLQRAGERYLRAEKKKEQMQLQKQLQKPSQDQQMHKQVQKQQQQSQEGSNGQ